MIISTRQSRALTEMQRVAIAHPCYLAGETLHPRFMLLVVGAWSVKITVNAGYE